MGKMTALEMGLEMHKDLRSALACVDGCDKEDIRNSFLISKIAALQEQITLLEERLSKYENETISIHG